MRRWTITMNLLAAFALCSGCGKADPSGSGPIEGTESLRTAASSAPDVEAPKNLPEETAPSLDEKPAPETTLPDSQLGVPGEGQPGTIKGLLKSPYARLVEGVVFVVQVKGREFELLQDNPVMDQKNKIFTPHILPFLAGSTVDFPNTDDVRHSVYSFSNSAQQFNLGQYDVGVVKHVTFDKGGVTELRCNIHTEMRGYVLALQNPYFATSSRRDGSFVISDVPPGRYELSFFHERIQEKTIEVTVEPGQDVEVEFTGLNRK